MPTALSRSLVTHPIVWIIGWAGAVVVSYLLAFGAVGPGLFGSLDSGTPTVPGPAADGMDLLADADPNGPGVNLLLTHIDPTDPDVAAAVTRARDRLTGDGRVSVADPYQDPADPALAIRADPDAQALLVTATLGRDLSDEDEVLARVGEELSALGRTLTQEQGARFHLGSNPMLLEEITGLAEQDLRTGESIALPISVLIMVVVFGGFLAASMPLLGAIASVGGGLLALLGWAHLLDLDSNVVNVVTVLGLGLCIDYGLILVSRFREELRVLPAHAPVGAALERTMQTAGRTVLFSGVTVAVALVGLLLLPSPMLRSFGVGGISVVLICLLTGLTLVPALLVLSGRRLLRPGGLTRVPGLRRIVAALGDTATEEGVFSRLARAVQRHPWLVLIGVTSVLVLLAVPSLSIQVRSSFTEMLPVDNPQRVYDDTLEETFPWARPAPVQVVFHGSDPQTVQDATGWAQDAVDLPGVDRADPPVTIGEHTLIGLRLDAPDSGGPQALQTARTVAAAAPDQPHLITGQAPLAMEFLDATIAAVPWAVGVIMAATLVLLFLMTGSVLIPVKALAMNVISLGATLGIFVWGFQEGNFESVLGFTSPGGIEAFLPPMIIAIGFGLAMDYEVFLLSRIKEAVDAGLDNDAAVVFGLQRSGRLITSAALIMVVVFLGFSFGQLLAIKEVGVALAFAVAVDATLVRLLLVPATMTLLGRWNWWAPAPLRRLHRRFDLSH